MPSSPPPEPPDHGWLEAERQRLWDFARHSPHPAGGFAWLDDRGQPDLGRPVEAWITCRMTHVAALEVLAGNGSAGEALDHGVRALETTLRDDVRGGWYAAVDPDGPVTPDKRAYEHAFVVLATASAVAAGHPRGEALAGEAQRVFEQRFWREDEGMAVDVWDRQWSSLEDYRGLNANMHAVEAFLAVHDVTGSRVWLERARSIVERAVHGIARAHGWMLPEHFAPDWTPLPDYNRDQPAHPFRPYGVTVGHLLEWSRLAVHLRTALGPEAPPWLLDEAAALFDTAVRVGWQVDGAEGFVYTTDFAGRPVVRDRLHWVVAEGIAAAHALWAVTGEERYEQWYARWWDHADRLFLDRGLGSWRHELDAQNRPSHGVWQGKPDVYHAYQAALLPSLGEIASFAGALSRRSR